MPVDIFARMMRWERETNRRLENISYEIVKNRAQKRANKENRTVYLYAYETKYGERYGFTVQAGRARDKGRWFTRFEPKNGAKNATRNG